MAWTIEYDEAAVRDLKKLDRQIQREILDYMDKRIARADDPRAFGKPLKGSKFGLWAIVCATTALSANCGKGG